MISHKYLLPFLCLFIISHVLHGADLGAQRESKREAEALQAERKQYYDEQAKRERETNIRRGLIAMGIESMPTKDERELKRLVEWESQVKPLETSVMENIVKQNFPETRHIVKAWERTPKVDEYNEFASDEEARGYCFRLPRKLMLVGTSNAGKSILAQAIAQKCKMRIFSKRGSEVADSYVRSGEQDLNNVFAHASAAHEKCVIIINDIDPMWSDHGSNMTKTLRRLLDAHKTKPILFIGTTNDISVAPPQIKECFGGYYTQCVSLVTLQEQQENLIKYYMNRNGVYNIDIENSVAIKEVAKGTIGLTRQETETLVGMTLTTYLDEKCKTDAILKDCFIEAFNKLKITVQLHNPSRLLSSELHDTKECTDKMHEKSMEIQSEPSLGKRAFYSFVTEACGAIGSAIGTKIANALLKTIQEPDI